MRELGDHTTNKREICEFEVSRVRHRRLKALQTRGSQQRSLEMLRIRHLVETTLACVVVLGIGGRVLAQTPLVQLNFNAAMKLGTVQVAGGAIDLTNGALIVTTSSFGFAPSAGNYQGTFASSYGGEYGTVGVAEYSTAAVHDALQEGSNYGTNPGAASSGFWNGTNGIMSSSAATNGQSILAVGYIDNSVSTYNTFRGVALDNTNYSQTIFATTYYGDANLDGVVNGDDYTLLAQTEQADVTGVTSAITGGPVQWVDGDFNGDGVVNGDDYTLLAQTQQAHLPPLYAAPTVVGAAAGVVAVPEPGTLGLLAAALCGLAMIRKRGIKIVTVAIVLAVALFVASQAANAALYIDLVDASTGLRTDTVTSTNETFTLDVYGVILDSSPNNTLDGVTTINTNFLVASSTLKGDVVSGTFTSNANIAQSSQGVPFTTSYGAQGLGGTSPTDTTANHWWKFAGASSPQTGGTYINSSMGTLSSSTGAIGTDPLGNAHGHFYWFLAWYYNLCIDDLSSSTGQWTDETAVLGRGNHSLCNIWCRPRWWQWYRQLLIEQR